MSRGIARFAALFAGCLLAITLAIPAWAASTQPTASQGHVSGHSSAKIVKAQVHSMPKASPDSVGSGFTEICGGDAGIILFDGSYSCMNQGYATYNTSGDPVVEAVVSFEPGRIWVHQTSAGGNGSYCLTPNLEATSTYGQMELHQVLANVQLSSNTDTCNEVSISVAFVCNQQSLIYAAWNSPSWSTTWCMDTTSPTTYNSDQASVAGLANYTGARLWFHGTTNGTAWSDCANPYTFYAVSGRDADPTTVQSTSNVSAC